MKTVATKKSWLKYSRTERKAFPFVFAILLIPIIHNLIFFVYVNFSSVSLAFQDTQGNWSLATMENVFNVLKTGVDSNGRNVWDSFSKSLIIFGLNNFIIFPISLFFAFMLTKHMVGSKVFRLVYHIPGIVGGVVFVMIMKSMYMAEGPVMTLLESMKMELPINALRDGLLAADETAFRTIVIQYFVLGIAGGDMIYAGAYSKIPDEIFESAHLDGCGFFREIFQIAIPCIWPTISTMRVLSLCTIFTADWNFYLYSGGTGDHGLVSGGFYLYRLQATISEYPNRVDLYHYLSGIGILLTAVTVPIVLIGKKIMAMIFDDVQF